MRFTLASSLVTLAVLAASAAGKEDGSHGAAVPIFKLSTLLEGNKNVNFHALRSHVRSVKGMLLGPEKSERHTGSMHPSAVKDTGKHGANVPLTEYNLNHKEGWYGYIEVGTPPKPFKVVFDTAISDTFIATPTCGSACSNRTLWDPEFSSTSTDLHKNFTLTFLDKTSFSGEQYTDDVSVAGFTARNQTLGIVKLYPGLRNSSFPDGRMGMAYQSLSVYNASPVFQSLVSQGQVKHRKFSFKLSSPGAELRIGGSDRHLYTGELSYTPVTHKAYWQVTLENIQSNNQTILCNIDSIIAIGTTSLVIGNASEVSALYSAIGGNSIGDGYYTFPCNSFPNISFTFGGKSFPIPASALNIGPLSNDSSHCLSGIIGQSDFPFWVLGDTFLKNVYTVFDYGKSRVGFAHLA